MILPRARALPITFIAALAALVASTTAGCGRYVPALFADRPAVTVVRDDKPIPIPSRTSFDEREQISDIYLRRPLFDVVRPLDFPTGGDVNALDEVPPSSWYEPQQPVLSPPGVTPPAPPLLVLDEKGTIADDALVVRDARGLRYELLVDPPEQSGLRTGAEVIGGYLIRGLGLRAPRSWIVTLPDSIFTTDGDKSRERLSSWVKTSAALVEGGRRVSATLWPGGVDVGVTSDYSVRRDDPNDKVPHRDRRTLRAMRIFAHWIGWNSFGVRTTRDVYVGKPGEGHLLHYFVGMSQTLGTRDVQPEAIYDEEAGSIGWKLLTLGLARSAVQPARQAPFPSIGYFPAELEPGTFDVNPPYSPFVRMQPADEYWAAKRLLDIPNEVFRMGVPAANLLPAAGDSLVDALQQRRQLLVAHAMIGVTPVDVTASVGRAVWLRDRAIAAGLAEAASTQYEVAFLAEDGSERAHGLRIKAVGELTAITLPADILVGLVVLNIRVVRAGFRWSRSCDVHVLPDRSSARVIGVRH